ncbi:transcription repressor NadR [Lottiidibacillus patelloidae]|uniref:Transcription repressor NadR n=1 Tax=Lottiidibacillus patelloidae TaxID=2670334 RepID=A0A263BVW5_9BACI|nr:transcription repressor NadR [Lottiidibacillus patelloidae]OZM57845.1 transcription repressor NadR [Lottiidibacillus patelloidae]
MKEAEKKILGEKRRSMLLQWLKESEQPLTGSELSNRTNVSRQVIVQDISLLKARNEPIMATAQGYVYFQHTKTDKPNKVVVSNHPPEKTEEELNIIVDFGVTVKDVTIEHPIYGDLTASLMLKNRHDVAMFIDKFTSTNASLLSELTDGVHLHTLEAEKMEQIDQACAALKQAGFILET